MRRSPVRLAAPILVLIAIAGCAGGTGGSPTAGPSATPDRRSPGPSLVVPSLPAGVDVPAELLAALIADASDRSGVAPDAIAVIEGAAVTWTDGSWGCPEPGVLYTQALVDGWRVIVDAGGDRIDYRAVSPDRFRICEGLPGT